MGNEMIKLHWYVCLCTGGIISCIGMATQSINNDYLLMTLIGFGLFLFGTYKYLEAIKWS